MLLSPSCFGHVSQSPLSLHCFSHLLSPSCFGPVRQYPQYLLDCQCPSLLLISCPIPAVKLFCLFHHICCRPYHVECTGSLPTSEVKRHRARLVLGWGTAWEDLRVLPAQQTRQGRGREGRGRRRRRRRGKGEGEGKGKGKRQRKRQRPSGLLPLPLPLHLNCHNRQIPVIAMLAVVFVELQKATHLGYSIHPRCRCAAQHG